MKHLRHIFESDEITDLDLTDIDDMFKVIADEWLIGKVDPTLLNDNILLDDWPVNSYSIWMNEESNRARTHNRPEVEIFANIDSSFYGSEKLLEFEDDVKSFLDRLSNVGYKCQHEYHYYMDDNIYASLEIFITI